MVVSKNIIYKGYVQGSVYSILAFFSLSLSFRPSLSDLFEFTRIFRTFFHSRYLLLIDLLNLSHIS